MDSLAALYAAQDAGMKGTVIVANAVRCPELPAPTGDSALFVATGKLAPLQVSIDAFITREDMGVAEAVAAFGRPVMCNQAESSGYMDIFIAPRNAAVRSVYLETHDGDLIGIVMEYEKPVLVDVTELSRKYGAAKRFPGPMDSHEAGGDSFSTQTAAFSGQLMFSHRDSRDPESARQVHQVIFRRSAMVEILPAVFRTADDLVRLIALALRPQAPEPVRFYGTLGVYDKTTGDHITFLEAVAMRNVENASIEKVTRDGRDFLTSVRVTFGAPVPADGPELSRMVAAHLHVAPPRVTTEGGKTRLDVNDALGKALGTILVTASPASATGGMGRSVTTIEITRSR